MQRILTIALLFGATVRLTHANPAAEKLFQDGRTALANNQLDAACEAFRNSEALEPRIGTLLNLGDCEERRKHVASAWGAFSDAKGLADRDHDSARSAEAARRAKVLEPKLPYLTIAVQQRVPGMVLQRNHVDVVAAEWDHDVPLDAGAYELTATAPGFRPWSAHIDVIEAQHLRVEVPALVALPIEKPVETKPVEKIVVVTPPPPPPPHGLDKHIGVGLLTGTDTDTDWLYGVRVVLNAAPLGPGVVRVVPSVMYTSTTDAMDPYRNYSLYAVGATFEYAYPVTDKLVAAGGLGFGFDFLDDNYGNSSHNGWGCLRVSPTLRLDRLDIGVHYQLVRTSDRFVSLFEVGLDFFVW